LAFSGSATERLGPETILAPAAVTAARGFAHLLGVADPHGDAVARLVAALVRAIVDPVDRDAAGLNVPLGDIEASQGGGDLGHDFRVAGAGGLRIGGDAGQAGSEQRLVGRGFGAGRAGDGEHGFIAIDAARIGRGAIAAGQDCQGGQTNKGRGDRFHVAAPLAMGVIARL
jgi:hypothetical protein